MVVENRILVSFFSALIFHNIIIHSITIIISILYYYNK